MAELRYSCSCQSQRTGLQNDLDRGSDLRWQSPVFKKNGYTHDAGPTVLTAPFLFDELFDLLKSKREEQVEFKTLDPGIATISTLAKILTIDQVFLKP